MQNVKCKHKHEKAGMSSLENSITNSIKQIIMKVEHLVKEIVDKARPLMSAEEYPLQSH